MARRRLGPLLLTIPMVLVLLGLGTWQVERLYWKEGLIAALDAARSAPPVAPPPSLAAAASLAYRRVAATGRFLHDKEFAVAAISQTGDYGLAVVTPLRLADGSFLLVNRGWVPKDRQSPDSRRAGEIAAETTITGLLRLPNARKPSWFTPDNRPEASQWYYIDPTAMAAAARLEGVLPYWIDADATPNPGAYPIGGQTIVDIPNNHLQYAITWYSLAMALIAIYLISERRRPRD